MTGVETEATNQEVIVVDGITFQVEFGSANREEMMAALEHIAKMMVEAQDGGSKCVDGGYRPGEMNGRLARPGADLGISMILLKLGLSPQKSLDLVKEFRINRNEKYGWHTDDHAVCGCGHCNAAQQLNNQERYGIEVEKVKQLWHLVSQLPDEKCDFIVLTRKHAEKGVLLIEGIRNTVMPWNGEENSEQYFIYDATRDRELLNDFYYFLREKYGIATQVENGRGVKIDDVEFNFSDLDIMTTDQTHREATLGLLGTSANQPIYAVNADEPVIKVRFVGTTPDYRETA